MATLVPATVSVRAYKAESADANFSEGIILRRPLREQDVSIKIHYCGICHTDLHMKKNEWGMTQYPVVPGHEITGVIDAVGSKVSLFKVGDRVGVGCIVDACLECDQCKDHRENVCRKGFTMTYGWGDKISGGVTYGGYSERYVVDEKFVLRIPDGLDLAAAAPLLCAGITTYSPLVEAGVKAGSRVGVIGIGGLGHLALKLAHALGAKVTAFTSKASKKDEMARLGADDVVVTTDPKEFERVAGTLDLLIDTVAADHDINPYLTALDLHGKLYQVGAPPKPMSVAIFPLIMREISIHGSGVGGIKRTQDMLNLCAEKKFAAEVEVVPLKDVDHAFERLEKGDVRYRFVLDIKGAYHQN